MNIDTMTRKFEALPYLRQNIKALETWQEKNPGADIRVECLENQLQFAGQLFGTLHFVCAKCGRNAITPFNFRDSGFKAETMCRMCQRDSLRT